MLAALALLILPVLALAAPGDDVPALQLSLSGGMTEPDKVSLALEILFLLTVLSLAPAIMMTVTSFTRIIIVFHFVRQAMGIQQMPPTQILASLAIFMTLIIMYPVGKEINDTALQPYLAEQIDFNEGSGQSAGASALFHVQAYKGKGYFHLLFHCQNGSAPQQGRCSYDDAGRCLCSQ